MRQNQFIIILVLLLISVIAWIGGNVYHNLKQSTISDAINQEITPIDPTFNLQTIESLKKRQIVDPVFELETLPTPSVSSPRASISSPSSNLNAKNATGEGKILQ